MQINVSITGMAGRYAEKALVNESFMREIGTYVLSVIRRRTAQGLDAMGNALQPLSAGYAKLKAKALGSARADLTVSGRMLNDMQILSASRNRVTVGFLSGSVGGSKASGGTFIQRSRSIPGGDKAYFHQVTGAGKSHILRKFFGLSDGEKATLRERVAKYVGEQFTKGQA